MNKQEFDQVAMAILHVMEEYGVKDEDLDMVWSLVRGYRKEVAEAEANLRAISLIPDWAARIARKRTVEPMSDLELDSLLDDEVPVEPYPGRSS